METNQLFNKSLPKYLGDEYNLLFDTLDDPDPLGYMYQRASLQLPVNTKLLTYMNGGNMMFIRSLLFHKAVNRVYKTDPEKYKKIWEGKDPKYPNRPVTLVFEKNGVKSTDQQKTPDYIYG